MSGWTFIFHLLNCVSFPLPQLADSKWTCWKTKQQVIKNLCFFFFTSLPSFFLASEMKTKDFDIARISLSFPCIYVLSSVWITSSAMGQLILYRNKYVFLLFQLPISNAVFFPSEVLWLDWFGLHIFYYSLLPLNFFCLSLSWIWDQKITYFAQAYETGYIT